MDDDRKFDRRVSGAGAIHHAFERYRTEFNAITRRAQARFEQCDWHGLLGEKVFEPLLASGGPLAGNLGRLIGVGAGRGLGLLFIIMGGLKMLASLYGYVQPHIRAIEDELPDLGVGVSADGL